MFTEILKKQINALFFTISTINNFRLKFSVSEDNQDFSPTTIVIGSSADTSNFNQPDFPDICANITQPFGFPETRNISCIT